MRWVQVAPASLLDGQGVRHNVFLMQPCEVHELVQSNTATSNTVTSNTVTSNNSFMRCSFAPVENKLEQVHPVTICCNSSSNSNFYRFVSFETNGVNGAELKKCGDVLGSDLKFLPRV